MPSQRYRYEKTILQCLIFCKNEACVNCGKENATTLTWLLIGPMKMSLFVKSSEKEEFWKILHNIPWYFVTEIVQVIEKNFEAEG